MLQSINSKFKNTARTVKNSILSNEYFLNVLENIFLYPHEEQRVPVIRNSCLGVIAGFFTSNSGIGEAARNELEYRLQQGEIICGLDLSKFFSVNDFSEYSFAYALEDISQDSNIVLHCNAPETARAIKALGNKVLGNRKRIGRWVWELEVFPRNWERAYSYIDEIWVPSTFVAQVFENAPVPVKVVPHPIPQCIDGGHTLVDLGLPVATTNRRKFLCMADCRSSLKRKNIEGTVSAFAQALGNNDHNCLIIKLHHTEFSSVELENIKRIAQIYNNIFIMERTLTSSERNSLLHRCDVFLSLHRAEGFGLFLAEGIALNKTVIATAYSGNMDFMNENNSILIPYTKVPIKSEAHFYKHYKNALWAEPDMDAAIMALRQYT